MSVPEKDQVHKNPSVHFEEHCTKLDASLAGHSFASKNKNHYCNFLCLSFSDPKYS